MNKIKDLEAKIKNINNRILELEKSRKNDIDNPVYDFHIAGLKAVLYDLNGQITEEILKYENNVIDYRISSQEISEKGMRINDLQAILSNFQKYFSLVYDVVRNNKPKMNQSISKVISRDSALRFKYSYDGSLGIVMTLDNSKQLVETDIDKAFYEASNLMSEINKDNIQEIISKYGYGTITALTNLIESHIDSDTSLSLTISSNKEKHIIKQIKKQDFSFKKELIENTPITTNEETSIKKVRLLGMDIEKRTFHVRYETSNISGTLSEQINQGYKIDEEYFTEIDITTSVLKGKKTVKYILKSITELSDNKI